MIRAFLVLGAAVALLVGASADAASPGNLDGSFGVGGKVVTDFGKEDAIFGVAVQPDGKIVAVGDSYSANGTSDTFIVARYSKPGVLDPEFALGGPIRTDFGRPVSAARAVALQRDGGIVVAGLTYSDATRADIAIARYDSHGSPDGSFGTNGEVMTDLGGSSEYATGVVIQPDGKIVIAGATRPPGSYDAHPPDFVVVRYTTDGALDASFGTGGIVTTGFQPGFSDIPYGVALGPGGKIVAAGTGLPGASGGPGVIDIARYTVNGALDPSFDGDGVLVSAPALDQGAYRGVVVQPDGKVVVAGYVYNSGMGLLRYTPAGTIDDGFGLAGAGISAAPAGAEALVLQPDGKFLVAGAKVFSETNAEFVVARFRRTGVLDPSFHGGYVLTNLGGWDAAQAVALAPDGKIVAGGVSGRLNNDGIIEHQNFALARYVGVPNCRVPNVLGRTLRAAKTAIASANCQLGRVGHRASARARGRVVRQRPAPGSTRPNGSKVDLLLSRGRP